MEIFIKILNEKSSIHVCGTSLIKHIKSDIKLKTGLNENDYKLKYEKSHMSVVLDDDNKTLSEYRISAGSEINIIDITENVTPIIFKTPKKGTFPFFASKKDKIKDLKFKIQNKMNLNFRNIILSHEQQILNDNRPIASYRLRNESVIHLDEKFAIFVEFENKKRYSVDIHTSDRVKDIKHKIYDTIGVHSNEQTLECEGKRLTDNEHVEIKKDSNVNILINNGIEILVKTIEGSTIELVVIKNQKIQDIRKAIQLKKKINVEDQILIYQDKILENEKSFNDYGISNKSLIYVAKLINKTQLVLLTIGELAAIFQFKQIESIIHIRKEIERKIRINTSKHCFFYNNILLNDDNKNIQKYKTNEEPVMIIACKQRNNTFICDIDENLKMSQIRTMIKHQLQFDSQRIIIKNKKLIDGKVLIEYETKKLQNSIIDYDFGKFMKAIKFNLIDYVIIHFKKEYLRLTYGSKLYYPIHYACKYGRAEISNFLIENECNLEVKDLENKTPIHLACINGDIDLVKLLINNQCKIDAIDYLKQSPIHLACKYEYKEIAELLIKNKCKLEIYDCFDRCPLDISKNLGWSDIINIIKIRKVIDAMNLSCKNDCNHKSFCFTSVISQNFDKGDLIRKEFCGVYNCKEEITGRDFALKIVNEKRRIFKNIELLEILKHERIIKYFGSFKKGQSVYIFMDYFKESLQQKIETFVRDGKNMLFDEIMHITKQILAGLKYLDEKKIIHRDIKPGSILLDENGNVKLTNFEYCLLSSNVENELSKTERFCGTKWYVAPEILKGEPYSCSADIWSTGIIVIQMVKERTYHDEDELRRIIELIQNGGTECDIPDSLVSLINKMCQKEESERPSASQLLKDEIFKIELEISESSA